MCICEAAIWIIHESLFYTQHTVGKPHYNRADCTVYIYTYVRPSWEQFCVQQINWQSVSYFMRHTVFCGKVTLLPEGGERRVLMECPKLEDSCSPVNSFVQLNKFQCQLLFWVFMFLKEKLQCDSARRLMTDLLTDWLRDVTKISQGHEMWSKFNITMFVIIFPKTLSWMEVLA